MSLYGTLLPERFWIPMDRSPRCLLCGLLQQEGINADLANIAISTNLCHAADINVGLKAARHLSSKPLYQDITLVCTGGSAYQFKRYPNISFGVIEVACIKVSDRPNIVFIPQHVIAVTKNVLFLCVLPQ